MVGRFRKRGFEDSSAAKCLKNKATCPLSSLAIKANAALQFAPYSEILMSDCNSRIKPKSLA